MAERGEAYREYQRAYYQAHKQELQKRYREYYWENKEQKRRYNRKHYLAHREKSVKLHGNVITNLKQDAWRKGRKSYWRGKRMEETKCEPWSEP